LLVASNPLDVMTELTRRLAGGKAVLGTGAFLDSIRFRTALARTLGGGPRMRLGSCRRRARINLSAFVVRSNHRRRITRVSHASRPPCYRMMTGMQLSAHAKKVARL